MFRWLNYKLAKVFRSKDGGFCCHCDRYVYSHRICGVYFLHNGETFCLRVSPWDQCLLVDLKEDIQEADMDQIKAEGEQIKREQKDVSKGEETKEEE